MKEYLTKNSSGNYQLVNHRFSEDDIEVPDGADIAFSPDLNRVVFKRSECGYSNAVTVWRRHKSPERLPFIDDEPKYTDDEVKYMDENGQGRSQSINDQYAEIEQVWKHRHYFKDVSNIAEIDVYAVLKLFDVTDPCLQHIVKKALCAGKRGHKDMMEDLQNIVDTAIRAVELNS